LNEKGTGNSQKGNCTHLVHVRTSVPTILAIITNVQLFF